MLVPLVIVRPGKVQGKRKSFWKSFWGCVVMLQETCQLLHLCIQHDVFRHTSYTVFSSTCLLLLCPPVLEDGTCGGVMSPCDLEGSSSLVLSKSPLNRDTKYCLEHLVTSDDSVPSPLLASPVPGWETELQVAFGVIFVFSDSTGLTLMLPPASASLVPLGDAYQKGLAIGDHFHICIKWSPGMKCPSLFSTHSQCIILEGSFSTPQLLKPLFFSLYDLCFIFYYLVQS